MLELNPLLNCFIFFQQLRLLKILSITHSNIPNIGRRTMWGLSGLKTLNLGHNKLTNVIDQNFDGTWHQYESAIVTP